MVTIKDRLVEALDDLGSQNLKKFKNKLCDRREEPRLRRGVVERVEDTMELADLLINTFTEKKVVQVTVEILKAIGCNQTAQDLSSDTGNSFSDLQPQAREYAVPALQVSGSISGPRPDTYDEPDTSSALMPSTPQFKQEIFREKGEEVYKVLDKNERKRLALLINNVDFDFKNMKRNGAQRDTENMEKLLRGLGYDVKKHINLSGQEMDEAIQNFAKRSEHKDSDSTFVVIMSHGKRDEILGVHYGPDNKTDVLRVDNIYRHLNTENCRYLCNKPKVILIQACRGAQEGGVWVPDTECEDERVMESDDVLEHQEKDFITLMSCTPDTMSFRHKENGAIFIRFLVEEFNKNAHKDHVEELFRLVMRRFDQFRSRKQMACKERVTLQKLFYLFPGL